VRARSFNFAEQVVAHITERTHDADVGGARLSRRLVVTAKPRLAKERAIPRTE
jgi:hypothetical protein